MPEQPTTPESETRHRAVLSYFQARQAGDPTFLSRMLAETSSDWQEMPIPQREAVSLVSRFMYPDNIMQRAAAAKTFLMIHRLLQEFELADTLEHQLTLPPNQSPDDPTV